MALVPRTTRTLELPTRFGDRAKLIVRRLLEVAVGVGPNSGLECLQLVLQLPIAGAKALNLALLVDQRIAEFGERALQVRELEFDLVEAGRIGHRGRVIGVP